jgi:hypothetical protein
MKLKNALQEMALEQVTGVTAFLLSLLFMRAVRMFSPHNRAIYLVLGVPPWRQLTVNDMYTKSAFHLF